VEAFERAFGRGGVAHGTAWTPGTPEVHLVLKSSNGHAAPDLRDALRARIADDPRITLMDRFLTHGSQMGLMASCDAYVSLHRSEGFGQGMAEAMLLGKPVIATAYSGNLSFMTPNNSALVPAGRVALGPDDYPYGQGQHWAQPDLEVAAACMQRAVREPAWCEALGQRGRADVMRSNGPQACARALRDAVSAMERGA
jgi:glycosyltransferase involved in cell wall biosynthesis